MKSAGSEFPVDPQKTDGKMMVLVSRPLKKKLVK